MDRICGVLLLSVLFLGCRQGAESPREAMVLCGSMGGVSKTDALTAGDEVAVFARLDGTEHYFLEAAKFTTGSDGKTLSATPAVYYPKPKQAVNFYAYFPYHTGVFSVPTDQSTASALKKADLCWANASSTPVSAPVPLTFQHLFARLIVQTNTSTEKIAIPNTFLGGTLDIKTGAFTNTLKSEVFTTGTELILPAQPLTRLVLTVSGVDYVFEPTSAVTLQAGQTTVLNLTLNPISQTVTLAAPVVTTANWTATAATDEPGQVVSNQFTAHWLVADYRFNQINRIDLTIKDQTTGITKDYTTSGVSMVTGSTIAAASYTFALSNVPDLHYPYTVSAIKFYQDAVLVHTATVNNSIAHTGAATLGWVQSISLTLSASTASVAATATSSTFTVTSNVPYTSSYTTGGASAQGTGAQPPYTNYSVTFTYPAQGATAAAARTHVMTITPTEDYTGNPNRRTFTVTQAAVPTSLSISAEDPGENVPKAGKVYLVDITSNTSWKSQNGVNGVTTNPASGTGSRTGVQVIVPASALTTARVVSIDFVTTAGLAGMSETTQTWLGMQEPPIYEVNGVKWAIGNLVADGANGCKIGTPTDYGLMFNFGSLIGWTGGTTGDGRGQGRPSLKVFVTPTIYTGPTSPWPAAYYNGGVQSNDYSLPSSDDPVAGVGDPCRFYLGIGYRTPTHNELISLTKKVTNSNIPWGSGENACYGPYRGIKGAWGGPGLLNNTGNPEMGVNVFFVAAGAVQYSTGLRYADGTWICYRTSSVSWGVHAKFFVITPDYYNVGEWYRYEGLSVRCIQVAK